MSKEDAYLDYLEGELSESENKDLEKLFEHSETDRLIVQGLKQTKNLVKKNQPREIELDDKFFDQLHDKIMKKVEAVDVARGALQTQVRSDVIAIPSKSKMIFFRSQKSSARAAWAMSFVILCIIASSFWMTTHRDQQIAKRQKIEDLPAVAASETLIGYQMQSDFLVDAATEKLDDLTMSELKEQLLKE